MKVSWGRFFFWAFNFFIFSSPLHALPRYAVQEGVGCSSCHVSPTGAGKHNDTGGSLFTQDLSLNKTKLLVPKETSGRLNPFVAMGSDVRLHKTFTPTPNTLSLTVPQGSFYLEMNAGKHVTGYLDQDFANTVNREAFVMIQDGSHPVRLYARAGRINLPYGLRVDDDTSFIRTNYNATFANQDIGAEFGFNPGPFELVAAVSNGVPGGVTDENRAKAVTASANWIAEWGRLGSSFQWNQRSAFRLTSGGLNGGFKIWQLIILGELDFQQSHSATTGSNTYLLAGFGEINWKAIDGLYVRSVYDFLDPDYKAPDNLQHRVGFGIDLYPLPHTQVSVLYRVNIGTGAAGDDQILSKIHFFF